MTKYLSINEGRNHHFTSLKDRIKNKDALSTPDEISYVMVLLFLHSTKKYGSQDY